MQAETAGSVAPGFESVQDAFRENFTKRGEVGAAFAAVKEGRVVVDVWGGLADPLHARAFSEDTLQLVWSGAKGFVAVCMLLLIERRLLRLDEPVARYWPEFAQARKEGVLVRHVVSHTAGLPGLSRPVSNEEFADCRRMARALERVRPLWPPGSRFYYHSFTYGWLCAELLWRTDGRSIGRFFADEVAAPLGLELWIGLPAEFESRVSTMHLWSQWERPTLDPVQQQVWTGPLLARDEEFAWNSRLFHAHEIPGANAIGTARSIARLYGCLACGGTVGGVRLLKEETVRLGQSLISTGHDPVTNRPRAYGVGFALQTEAQPFGPVESGFGHGGAGGSIHGAWPKQQIGFSYAMNEMRDELVDSRADALLRALYASVDRQS